MKNSGYGAKEIEVITHDVLIFGTGLAGLRAAVEIARKFRDTINMGLVSKVQIQRPHSVCAEGGSAAARFFSDWVARETIFKEKIMNGTNPLKRSRWMQNEDV